MSRTPVRVLHLSDLALSSTADGVAGVRAVEGLLDDLSDLPAVDLVVVSGDVTADGTSTAYAAARRLVGGFAAAHDAPHVYAVGDRDHPGRFAEVLGSGHLGPDEIDVGGAGPVQERHGWVSRVGDLRVVTVDTRVRAARHGAVGEAQARWLTAVLSTPAPAGTVLVLHHPPMTPSSHPHLAARALEDPERLAAAVRGSDVQVVLAGHLGVAMTGTLAGVPVVVAPGAVGRTDLTSAGHLDRVVHEGGASVVELGGLCSPLHHTVWSRPTQTARLVDQRDTRPGAVATREPAPPRAAAPLPPVLEDTAAWAPVGESSAPPPLSRASAADGAVRSVETHEEVEPVDPGGPGDPEPAADDSGVLSWAFAADAGDEDRREEPSDVR